MPSLYQITSVTLSCDEDDDDDIEFGNKSHGNVTSKPVAVCTSDNGPEKTIKRGKNKFEEMFTFHLLSFYWILPFFPFTNLRACKECQFIIPLHRVKGLENIYFSV